MVKVNFSRPGNIIHTGSSSTHLYCNIIIQKNDLKVDWHLKKLLFVPFSTLLLEFGPTEGLGHLGFSLHDNPYALDMLRSSAPSLALFCGRYIF